MDDDTCLWGANVPHFYNMGVSYHRVPANLWSVPLSPGPAHRSQELSLVPRHLRRTARKSCPDWKQSPDPREPPPILWDSSLFFTPPVPPTSQRHLCLSFHQKTTLALNHGPKPSVPESGSI